LHGGYHGKYLEIDLLSEVITIGETDWELVDKFLGGKGLGLALLARYDTSISAFDAGNPMIFLTGPLTGTSITTSNRSCLVTRSPLTGGFLDSHAGGHFGTAIRGSGYDYIIIDSPPALGPITINALSASDSVIIPIQCEFFALEGLAQLLNTVSLLKKTINPKLKIKGFLPTMYSKQNNLSKQVLADLSHHFKDKLFRLKKGKECIVVPRNVKVAESPSFGQPVIHYAGSSKGSIAYRELASAIIKG
jgi:hypothetical protein